MVGHTNTPSLTQLAAWHEAQEQIPGLTREAAVGIVRERSRSAWLRMAIDAGTISTTILGAFSMPSDCDRRWPVLVCRMTRRKTSTARRRMEIVLLTKTEPGRWLVLERSSIPPDLRPLKSTVEYPNRG